MKMFISAAALWRLASVAHAQTGPADIVGKWESDKKDTRLEIFQNGQEYQGRLLWGNLVVEPDGVTSKKDAKNPNPALRSRPIIGLVNLTGLKWDGEEYTGGRIYNAAGGDTYNCKAWVKDGKLNLRGYLGMPMLGQTVTWHRYQPTK